MAYTKTTWEAQTPISPSRLNNLESQYSEALEYWGSNPFLGLTNLAFYPEILSADPTHGTGRIYANSSTNRLKVSTGVAWVELEGAVY